MTINLHFVASLVFHPSITSQEKTSGGHSSPQFFVFCFRLRSSATREAAECETERDG